MADLSDINCGSDSKSLSETQLHRELFQKRGFLKKIYNDWYAFFMEESKKLPEGALVELGSGGGFLKEVMPNVITSDILPLPWIDLSFSGSSMPFKNESVSAFFMINVLHHIKDPAMFFKEADRCLAENGKIIMIEPASTAWGRFIWKNFHHEDFDDEAGWEVKGGDSLQYSNSALPWIIFFRDRGLFEKRFPRLKINKLESHTPARYLISGGFSAPQLLPSFTYNYIKGLEYVLSGMNRYIGMFLSIEIEKNRV